MRAGILQIMSLAFFATVADATDLNGQQILEKKVSFEFKDAKISQVLDEIERGLGCHFTYQGSAIDVGKTVNLAISNMELGDALQKIFEDRVTIEAFDNEILLMPLESPRNANLSKFQKNIMLIKGKVVEENSQPLPGVNVIIKGTTIGTTTDAEGEFSINVPDESSVLVFSFIGFMSKEIPVGNQSEIIVTLLADIKALEEVVVVGYGLMKKSDVTGSVVAIDGDRLQKTQFAQTSMALQGIAPGVTVTQRSGQPGNDQGIISIRGLTTLNNNNVLVLVDNVEMNLNNIDPSLIESISILKDAAAASIYGSRAANGVILVTTKRAGKEEFSITYNGYVATQVPTNQREMVGAVDHMNLINEAYINTGKSPLFSEPFIQAYPENMKLNPDQYPDTDWFDEVLSKSAPMQNHFITISGGTSRSRVMASLGYLDQDGVIPNTNFKRYTLRLNSDMELSKLFSTQFDIQLTQGLTTSPSRSVDVIVDQAGYIPANLPAQFSNGLWGEGWTGLNPLASSLDGGLNKKEDPSVTLNMGLKYTPAKWMFIDVNYSPSYYESNSDVYNKSIQTYTWDGTKSYVSPQIGSLRVTNNRYFQNNLRTRLQTENVWGNSMVKLLVGYQHESFDYRYLTGYRQSYIFDDYPVLNAGGAANQQTGGSEYEWAINSLFGRFNYSFKNRYLFEANFRYDGSSRFSEGNRWGLFPSLAVGWKVSEEPFFAPLRDKITNLKVRTSWGQLGNQNIGYYPSQSTVTLGLDYVFNNAIFPGAAVTNMANSDISWETTTISNIGIDITLFNKLTLVAEYYNKITDGILLTLDVPKTTGLNAPYQNAGKVQNVGWDLGLNYVDWGGKFKYDIGFNISDVRNEILDLKGVANSGATVNWEGYEMNSILGLQADGFISPSDFDSNGKYLHATQYGNFAAGDIKYVDQNNDGVINADDYVILGGTIPRFTYGLNINTSLSNFDLSLQIQGVGEANGLLYEHGIWPFFSGGSVQEQHKDRWTPEHTNSMFPRLAFNETNNEKISSFWMKNAAYMRLKNLQIGYSLPQEILDKIRVRNLRMYVSATNIFTISNFWKGYDVEAPVGNGGYFPQQKTYSIGVNLTL